VSYAGFWRGQARLSLDDFLVKASTLGFDGVMLVAKKPHLSLLDYDKAAREKLKNRIKALNLELVALAGYTDFTAGIDKPGIPHTEIQAAYVGQLAELASDLDCSMIRIFTGYVRADVPYDKQYATVVEGLRLAGDEAAKYNVMLAVQNHHDIALHHDEMYWLMKEVDHPYVKVGWDAWSPTLEGLSTEEIEASVFKLKPYIVNTIAADYRRMPQFRYENSKTNYLKADDVLRAVPMGEGIIDYETFIPALKKIGYQGYVVYELCEVLDGGGSEENLDATALKFLEYMKKFE
jgi:sugar phosphate isomerase/epimerase